MFVFYFIFLPYDQIWILFKDACLQYQTSKTPMCQTKLQTLSPHFSPPPSPLLNHVIWLQSEGSHSPFLPMSLFHSLSLSQSSTVEQNVRLWSGKRQYVLASQLDFEAAQRPALNQRASLCSALTKIYPEQQKNTSKNKTNSSVPARGGWGGGGRGGLPAALHAASKWRSCQNWRLQIKPGE